MADTVPSNLAKASLVQLDSLLGPVEVATLSTNQDPCHHVNIDRPSHNQQFKSSVRRHIRTLFEEESDKVPYCIVVCDADMTVIDVLGNRDIINLLTAHGMTPGSKIIDVNLLPHETRLTAIALPIILSNKCTVGSLTLFTKTETESCWIRPFLQSVVSAVTQTMESQSYLRDNTLMYQALLSHLDYHVVRIAPDGTTRNYHPIPLQDAVHAQMLAYTRNNPDGDDEVSFGDRLYSCVVRTLLYPTGMPAGRLGMFRDITEQRQIEWKMRDADRITVLASLAAGIAHEIRNPLTTAKGFLQLFAERQIGNPDGRYIDLTIRELDRIQQLVKDFMSLARPDSPHHHLVDLNHVVSEVINFMYPEALLHNVTLTLYTEITPLYVHGDPNQLKQVLMNVLQNALHACDKQGEVCITTTRKSSSAIVDIEDTGVGLSQEQLSQVFQPFYTTKDSGTGLGLAICRQIMREHGGSIHISSQVGVGTTVTLQLPVNEDRTDH